jgi:hypothetical protein
VVIDGRLFLFLLLRCALSRRSEPNSLAAPILLKKLNTGCFDRITDFLHGVFSPSEIAIDSF